MQNIVIVNVEFFLDKTEYKFVGLFGKQPLINFKRLKFFMV